MSAKDKHGLFDFRGAIPAPPPVLVPAVTANEALCMLTSMEDVRGAVRRAASGAQRLMSILTEDLEPEIYDHPVFLETVKRFILSRSFAKVRVLLHDQSRLIGNSNRFIAMSRRLASCIEIRVVAPAGLCRIGAAARPGLAPVIFSTLRLTAQKELVLRLRGLEP